MSFKRGNVGKFLTSATPPSFDGIAPASASGVSGILCREASQWHSRIQGRGSELPSVAKCLCASLCRSLRLGSRIDLSHFGSGRVAGGLHTPGIRPSDSAETLLRLITGP